eukprot:Gb_38355 [translate_table: standard]
MEIQRNKSEEDEDDDCVCLDESFFINDCYEMRTFTYGSHVLRLLCLESASRGAATGFVGGTIDFGARGAPIVALLGRASGTDQLELAKLGEAELETKGLVVGIGTPQVIVVVLLENNELLQLLLCELQVCFYLPYMLSQVLICEIQLQNLGPCPLAVTISNQPFDLSYHFLTTYCNLLKDFLPSFWCLLNPSCFFHLGQCGLAASPLPLWAIPPIKGPTDVLPLRLLLKTRKRDGQDNFEKGHAFVAQQGFLPVLAKTLMTPISWIKIASSEVVASDSFS